MNTATVTLIIELIKAIAAIGPEAAHLALKLKQTLTLSPDFADNLKALTAEDLQANEDTINTVNQWLIKNGLPQAVITAGGGPEQVPKL